MDQDSCKRLKMLDEEIGRIFRPNWYSSIVNKISHFFEKLSRSYQYAKLGWKNEEWDYTFFLDVLGFKLKRMLHELNNDEFHEHGKSLKALKLAVYLCDKINYHTGSADHYDYYIKKHYEKYGEPDYVFEPKAEEGCDIQLFAMVNKTSENWSEEEKEQERRDFIIAMDADSADMQQDIDDLFRIISKHMTGWWC